MKKNLMMITALGLALGSCGGGDGGLGASGNSTGLFSAGSAPFALTNFTTFLQTNRMGTLPDDLGSNTAPFVVMATPYDNCKTYEIGTSTTDDHYKIKYECEKVDDGGDTVTWLGTREEKVADRNDFSAGYRQDMDLFYEEDTSNGSYFSNEYKGFNELTKSTTQITFESEFVIRTVLDPHDPPVDWTSERKIKTVYTPDDMTDPEASGKLEMQAFYKISGKIGGGPNGEDYGETDITFEITSKDLIYDKNCGKGFKSGSMTFGDGSDNGLNIVYDCDNLEVTFNGTVIDW